MSKTMDGVRLLKYITGCMDLRSIAALQIVRDPVLLESENIYGEPILVEMIWGLWQRWRDPTSDKDISLLQWGMARRRPLLKILPWHAFILVAWLPLMELIFWRSIFKSSHRNSFESGVRIDSSSTVPDLQILCTSRGFNKSRQCDMLHSQCW